MTITAAGATSNFSLSGNGTGAQFSYAVSTPDGSTPLNIGGLVTVPDAVVGEKSSVTVRVRNTGNADARIATLAVNGTGYTITDAPHPVTVPIGGQIAFTSTSPPPPPDAPPTASASVATISRSPPTVSARPSLTTSPLPARPPPSPPAARSTSSPPASANPTTSPSPSPTPAPRPPR
ncbi:MAG: hypothetical protein IPJ98_24650 [Bryobacterales bacterium]|nr:hypothetical protein [Bryobacterales bacterium]